MSAYGKPLGSVGVVAIAITLGLTGAWSSWLGLAPPAAITLSLLFVAAALWISEAIPLFVTSLVLLLMEGVWLAPTLVEPGARPNIAQFTAPFFSNIILLFLGGFTLSAAFHKFLIDEALARWVIRRTGGRPWSVLAGVMAVTAFLSMWMSNTATAAMMLSLSVPLLAKVPEQDAFHKALVLGIAFAANLGGLATPIGTPPNAIVLEAMKAQGVEVGFASWILMSLPVVAVLLGGLWWLLRRLYPTSVEHVALVRSRAFEWTTETRVVIGVSVVTALGWLTDGLHPLPTGMVALCPIVILFGLGTLTRDDFRGLAWDVLFLAGGGLSLGVAVQVSGLGDAIVSLIPAEGMGMALLVTLLALVAATMTSVMSNTATANLLVPVVVGMVGVATQPLLMVVAYACSVVMILPVSTPPNAIAFSAGVLSTSDMVKSGLVVSGVGLVLTVTVGRLWWSLLGVG